MRKLTLVASLICIIFTYSWANSKQKKVFDKYWNRRISTMARRFETHKPALLIKMVNRFATLAKEGEAASKRKHAVEGMGMIATSVRSDEARFEIIKNLGEILELGINSKKKTTSNENKAWHASASKSLDLLSEFYHSKKPYMTTAHRQMIHRIVGRLAGNQDEKTSFTINHQAVIKKLERLKP